MKKINKCRFCKSRKLSDVLKLGNQFLTGVFLKNKNSKISLSLSDEKKYAVAFVTISL